MLNWGSERIKAGPWRHDLKVIAGAGGTEMRSAKEGLAMVGGQQ